MKDDRAKRYNKSAIRNPQSKIALQARLKHSSIDIRHLSLHSFFIRFDWPFVWPAAAPTPLAQT
jgi:hypothetical protein